MNTLSQHNESGFKIKQIKVLEVSFKQLNNIISNDIPFSIKTQMGNSYSDLDEDIQVNLKLVIEIYQKNDTEDIRIALFTGVIAGIFSYKPPLDEKVLPNLVSMLYSYMRPIVAQLSIMGKLPPIDIPILNLRDIKVEKEIK